MEIVIENPSSELSTTSVTSATTTIGSDSGMITTSPVTPVFAALTSSNNRPYRTAYVTNDGQLAQSVDYYHTLHPQPFRNRNPSPEPIYDTNLPIQTSLRRVDRSGLLEIVEPEPHTTNTRSRHSRSNDPTGHSTSCTLPRRIDRSGLLEAVPELPDQYQNWKNDDPLENLATSSREEIPRDNSTLERKLTGAESNIQRQNSTIRRSQTSPRSSRTINDSTICQSTNKRSSMEIPGSSEDNDSSVKFIENRGKTSSPNNPTTVTSPYLRRYPCDNSTSNVERPTPVIVRDETRASNNSFTCVSPAANKFLPIDSLPSRSRQTYVDLTGSTYTRSEPSATPSPIESTRTGGASESIQTNFNESENSKRLTPQQPDCLGRLSPRSISERHSTLTMSSSIPDVIEAHGSRSHRRDTLMAKSPEGERVEAEGCEQRAHNDDNSEDARIPFKGPKKILHNDNIQTLRVIILSEQL